MKDDNARNPQLHTHIQLQICARTSSLPEKRDMYGATGVELPCPLDLELDPKGLLAIEQRRTNQNRKKREIEFKQTEEIEYAGFKKSVNIKRKISEKDVGNRCTSEIILNCRRKN